MQGVRPVVSHISLKVELKRFMSLYFITNMWESSSSATLFRLSFSPECSIPSLNGWELKYVKMSCEKLTLKSIINVMRSLRSWWVEQSRSLGEHEINLLDRKYEALIEFNFIMRIRTISVEKLPSGVINAETNSLREFNQSQSWLLQL